MERRRIPVVSEPAVMFDDAQAAMALATKRLVDGDRDELVSSDNLLWR